MVVLGPWSGSRVVDLFVEDSEAQGMSCVPGVSVWSWKCRVPGWDLVQDHHVVLKFQFVSSPVSSKGLGPGKTDFRCLTIGEGSGNAAAPCPCPFHVTKGQMKRSNPPVQR